jgi:hypothetical protein
MKKYFPKFAIVIAILSVFAFTSCTENYSNGERIGLISKFSKKGWMLKTWEGDLTLTQTGMNQSANEFAFSLDRDQEHEKIANTIDSAARFGYKVKLTYHEVRGWNWFSNRGETDYFVTNAVILDKNHVGKFLGGANTAACNSNIPHDTIYVVIVGSSAKNVIIK